MIVPLFLFLLSLFALALGSQPGLSDLLLIAVPWAVASLFLVIRAWLGRSPDPRVRHDTTPRRRSHPLADDGPNVLRWRDFTSRAKPRWIVIDGSNVMHWQDNTPRMSTLRAVVDHLTALGFTPGVVFDANAGYKIGDRYQHDGALGKMLGLPADRVLVAPKGKPADPFVLASARDLGARIVTNDRYRDWAEHHPEVTTPGHLIRGGFQDGKLWLDLDPG